MSCLTNVLEVIYPDTAETPEDIFAFAPGLIFTDDIVNLHGTPDALIVYKSARFGNIKLRTADPSIERERVLFSHFLWNAGLKLAELISNDPGWSVAGETVVELGAGVGLAGIVATLAGAQHVKPMRSITQLSNRLTGGARAYLRTILLRSCLTT